MRASLTIVNGPARGNGSDVKPILPGEPASDAILGENKPRRDGEHQNAAGMLGPSAPGSFFSEKGFSLINRVLYLITAGISGQGELLPQTQRVHFAS